MRYETPETFLLLGGGGLVGQAIAYEIARQLNPKRIIICALRIEEARESVRKLRKEYPGVKALGVSGNVFVRHEWKNAFSHEYLMKDEARREALFDDTFGKLDHAYERSELVWLIETYSPDVIIDSINTATALSYQDVYSASYIAREQMAGLRNPRRKSRNDLDTSARAVDEVIISQSIPQLVRHVLLINKAMREEGTRLYLKIGTTGTGGMGLNIPYTHSEESPSATLMEKTAVAFAQTGLLYLMARTLGGPAVKEFKPAAMIGYGDISYRAQKVGAAGKVGAPGQNVKLYAGATETIKAKGELRLRPDQHAEAGYKVHGDLKLPVVNTGENGLFTKGEFQAITAMRQMEFITPEEIARQVVLEIKGSNTGYDVIGAIDGASMNPTYRAGYLRRFAIDELQKLEDSLNVPSVALGNVGPPELGKLLWEAYLLHKVFQKKSGHENELQKVIGETKESIAQSLDELVQADEQLRNTIVSVGFPILRRDGRSLIRGPYIRIPEQKNRATTKYQLRDIDNWAERGWIDLRSANMERWRQRFTKMLNETKTVRERGSAAFTREAYLWDEIRIGVVVAWIFNNEENFGYRIK